MRIYKCFLFAKLTKICNVQKAQPGLFGAGSSTSAHWHSAPSSTSHLRRFAADSAQLSYCTLKLKYIFSDLGG